MRFPQSLTPQAPLDPRAHEMAAIRVERRERLDGLQRGGREDVAVVVDDPVAHAQHPGCLHSCLLGKVVPGRRSPPFRRADVTFADPVVQKHERLPKEPFVAEFGAWGRPRAGLDEHADDDAAVLRAAVLGLVRRRPACLRRS